MEYSESSNNSSLISLIEVSEYNSENGSMISLIEIDESEDDEPCVNEVKLKNVKRAVRNWRKCLACEIREHLHRPSKEMRFYICKSQKIYILENDRVCDYHAQSQNWDQIRFKTASSFSGKAVDEMFNFLLNPPLSANENLNSSHVEIGLSDAQFHQVICELGLSENPNKTQKRMIMDVRIYMERLRHGHTFEQMAHRYNVKRQTIGEKVKRGRDILLQNFVPKHLGNANREWLISHTTELARILFCKNNANICVIVCDGTYIYTCSSTNYAHQRKVYSCQKQRHLFKIMKIVAADGTILAVFGPFEATKNDAEILRTVFNDTSIGDLLHPGDVILLDRGFRDCLQFLRNKNFDARIPAFIEKGNNGQLTSIQDNQSRLITKLRFVIEVANGRMKEKWHLFGKIIPSILTKHLMSDYKIGAALLNLFAKPIICDRDDFLCIGTRMLSLVNTKNELRHIINSKTFQHTERSYFNFIEPSELYFPRFNQKQMKEFALGTYVIKQAISYAAEHKKLQGNFKISELPAKHIWAHFGSICTKENFEKPIFILAKIKSRYRGQKIHTVYILYDMSILQKKMFYFCKCQHGQRTIGSCAHVMTVVWYFAYGQYETAKDPASHLNDFFNRIV